MRGLVHVQAMILGACRCSREERKTVSRSGFDCECRRRRRRRVGTEGAAVVRLLLLVLLLVLMLVLLLV